MGLPLWVIQLIGIIGALSIPVGFIGTIRVIVSARDAFRELTKSIKGAPDEPGLLARVSVLEADVRLHRETLIESTLLERRRAKRDPS